jgi:hypothetical protein
MHSQAPIPPRIALFPASHAPLVAAILRVRSKLYHVVTIDAQGIVTRGSWFRGAKIMVDKCSMSPDGSLMAYMATRNANAGWSGLCRPPWLHCETQVHEAMPFNASCAFAFDDDGAVCMPDPVQEINLSEDELRQVVTTAVGHAVARTIVDKILRDQATMRSDLRQSAAWCRHQGLLIRHTQPAHNRMEKQGFVAIEGGRRWSWTGPDGVVRTVDGRSGGRGLWQALTCCVDAQGRWWQAANGVISCQDVTKSGMRSLFHIDTTTWSIPSLKDPP